MSNPSSFRFPFTMPEDVHPEVAKALRYVFSGLKDTNDAIAALVPKVNGHGSTITTINETVNAISSGGGGSTPDVDAVIGLVNLQPNPVGGTAYTTQTRDYGGLIVVQSTPAFTVTLNTGLLTPFFTSVYNLGVGTVTLVPSSGQVNNGGSITVVTGEFATVFFDGTNHWAMFPFIGQTAQTFAAVTHQWIKSYDAATGLFTAAQPDYSDLTGTPSIPAPSSTLPIIDGTATIGTATTYARADHIHPTDTSRAPTAAPSFTGTFKIALAGVQVFANNAAAIAGGLVAGNLYRTGADPSVVCIVF